MRRARALGVRSPPRRAARAGVRARDGRLPGPARALRLPPAVWSMDGLAPARYARAGRRPGAPGRRGLAPASLGGRGQSVRRRHTGEQRAVVEPFACPLALACRARGGAESGLARARAHGARRGRARTGGPRRRSVASPPRPSGCGGCAGRLLRHRRGALSGDDRGRLLGQPALRAPRVGVDRVAGGRWRGPDRGPRPARRRAGGPAGWSTGRGRRCAWERGCRGGPADRGGSGAARSHRVRGRRGGARPSNARGSTSSSRPRSTPSAPATSRASAPPPRTARIRPIWRGSWRYRSAACTAPGVAGSCSGRRRSRWPAWCESILVPGAASRSRAWASGR